MTLSFLGTVAVWGILLLTLVLSPALGSASSVLALLLGLTLLPVAWREGAVAEVRKAPAQMIFIGVVVALTVLYAITARQPTDVLFFANFLAMPLSALIYVIALSQRGETALVRLARICTLGAIVALGFAFYDIYGRGLTRAQGLIGNPNLMPRLVLPLGFVAMAGFFVETNWRRWLYLLGPVAAIIVTVLTESRGAALAVPAMAAIAAIFLWQDKQGRRLVIVGGGIGLLALAAGLLILGDDLLGRFGSIAETIGNVLHTGRAAGDGSTADRLRMYDAGFAAFLQSPWIGWGWANLGNAAAELRPEHFANEAGTMFMFHNDAINFAVAGGVVGLTCLLALLVAPVVGALASPRDRYFAVRLYCCLVLSVGYAIFGLTDSTLGYDAPTTLYAFLTAMVLGAFRERDVAGADGAVLHRRDATQ